jgi:hypothetical protein
MLNPTSAPKAPASAPLPNGGIATILPPQQQQQQQRLGGAQPVAPQQGAQQPPQAGMGDIAKIQADLRNLSATDPRTMQILTSYANGANPMVPQFLALGEIKRREAMQQQPPQPPQGTVKDKVEQAAGVMALQQAKQQQAMQAMANQAMQAPSPVPQGIPQSTMGMAGGGVTALPVRDEMFNYAGGGIVAFANPENDQVVKEKDTEEKLPSGGIKYDTERRLPTRHGKDAAGDEFMRSLANMAGSATESVGDFLKRLVNPNAEIAAKLGIPEQKPSAAPEVNIDSLMTPVSNTNLSTQPPKEKLPEGAKTPAKQLQQPGTVKTTTTPPVPAGNTVNPSKQPVSGMDQASRYLLSQLTSDELPAYKSRDALLAEAAKTRPEISANPEEGMRKLMALLGQTQEQTRARAEQGESRQSLADLSVALNQAANATRGKKGSGFADALGGFGAGYAPAVAAANQRQASRDALMLEQQTTQAKMQYELQEKERARAVGDVDKEMVHAQNYAALKDKLADNSRDAAKSYLSDERARSEGVLNRANQLEQARISAGGRSGGPEGLRLKYLDQQQDSLVAELAKISPLMKEQRAPLEAKLAIIRKELAKLTGIDTIGGNVPPPNPQGGASGGNTALYNQADAILNGKK